MKEVLPQSYGNGTKEEFDDSSYIEATRRNMEYSENCQNSENNNNLLEIEGSNEYMMERIENNNENNDENNDENNNENNNKNNNNNNNRNIYPGHLTRVHEIPTLKNSFKWEYKTFLWHLYPYQLNYRNKFQLILSPYFDFLPECSLFLFRIAACIYHIYMMTYVEYPDDAKYHMTNWQWYLVVLTTYVTFLSSAIGYGEMVYLQYKRNYKYENTDENNNYDRYLITNSSEIPISESKFLVFVSIFYLPFVTLRSLRLSAKNVIRRANDSFLNRVYNQIPHCGKSKNIGVGKYCSSTVTYVSSFCINDDNKNFPKPQNDSNTTVSWDLENTFASYNHTALNYIGKQYITLKDCQNCQNNFKNYNNNSKIDRHQSSRYIIKDEKKSSENSENNLEISEKNENIPKYSPKYAFFNLTIPSVVQTMAIDAYLTVVLLFWGILIHNETILMDTTCYYKHLFGGLTVMVGALMGRLPYTLASVIHSLVLGVCYLITTLIVYSQDIMIRGQAKPGIVYSVLDFVDKPSLAIILLLFTIFFLLPILHCIYYMCSRAKNADILPPPQSMCICFQQELKQPLKTV